MRRGLRRAALLLLAVVLPACAVTADGEGRVERELRYTPPDWPQALTLDVYEPVGDGPFPAVLLIHGGAWQRGSRAHMAPVARQLAAHGYVAVNVDYRLAPAYRFPAPLQDLQQALRWTQANAARYRIDPQRLAAWGYSAGANLAALLGGIGTAPPYGAASVRLRAVVAGGTPADLTRFPDNRMVEAYLGAPCSQAAALCRAASPALQVDAQDPPVFLYHGSGDRLVPIAQAQTYRQALDAAGVPNALFVVSGAGHIGAVRHGDEAVRAALEFLGRHLRG
ncbi:alpha/beta hydrolase [Solimonas variicoloris]|uniref:alpha/beta hydrolase n=1 Tax=Solimonas variicoloris TaxID=254408 RepID=UPI00036B9F47|nr:alpha/beta hydrolase [Solimonas variicoloris]